MSDRAVGIVAKAIQGGDEDGVRKVVKAGACGPNAILPSGDPILLHAIMKGQTGIVTTLLELGADVNLPGNEKDTPLIRSAIFGRKEIIPLLLKAGAGTSISVRLSAFFSLSLSLSLFPLYLLQNERRLFT